MLLQSHSFMSFYHWHPHDSSKIKHASVYYLFAAVQNIRNNLSDTLVMLVTIDTTFKSMNVLHWMHTRYQVGWRANLYTSSSYKSPLLCCRCSPWMLQIFLVSTPSPFCLFKPVSLSLLSLYCSLLCWRRPSVSSQHQQWTPTSIIQVTHAETVIYLDNSPWLEPLHIPNMAK